LQWFPDHRTGGTGKVKDMFQLVSMITLALVLHEDLIDGVPANRGERMNGGPAIRKIDQSIACSS
jgi:hypothetical protein